jgi:hypothetical protein
MLVQYVEPKFVVGIWNDLKPYVETALEHTDDYSAEQCKVFLTNGSWLLFVAVEDGVQVTRAILVDTVDAATAATLLKYGASPHCTVRYVAAGPVPFAFVAVRVKVTSVLLGMPVTDA